MIEIIDKDTVKITTERIIDLRPLKKRLIDIEEELKAVEKEPDMSENEHKYFAKESLEEESKQIKIELANYK